MALGKLAEEDPTFQVKTDESSGQTIISGMGELHLDIIVDRLKREFKVEVNQGKPQVEYKEALTSKSDHVKFTKNKQEVEVNLQTLFFQWNPVKMVNLDWNLSI